MNGLLRRRGDLAPILSSSSSSSQRALDETDDPFEAYVISTPCFITVSNDPIDPDGVPELDDPCSITRYECNHGTPESDLTQVSIDFDYELHYRPTGNLTLTIESLETNVLQHLAASTGLVNCPITSTQRRDPGRRRSLVEDLDAVVALESEPLDTPDPLFTDCIVPVQASEVRGAVCLPMKGSLVATIYNTTTSTTTTSAVRSDILRIIRLGMKEDTYVFGNVQKVSFIGDRVGQQTDGVSTGETKIERGGGGLSNGAIAGISIGGVCLLLLLALMLLLVRKRKREDDSEERKMELDGSDMLEEDFRGEGGVEPWLPMAAPAAAATVAATTASQVGGDGDELLLPMGPAPAAKGHSKRSTDPNSMAARDTLALQPQNEVHKTTSELTVDDGTASLSSGTRSSGSPPGAAGSPNKQRRKKKKKRSPQRPGEQELLQPLDSIAEHPQEDEALQDSDRDDLPSIA